MSRSFSPREVPSSAWKTWAKDAARLCSRLGWTWGVLWCLGLPALIYMINEIMGASLAWVLTLLALQMVGVLFMPVLQHALDRAASGQPPSPSEDIALAIAEISAQRRWYLSALLGQVIVFFLFLGIASAIYYFSGPSEASATTDRALNGTLNLLIFFVLLPVIGRRGGMFSFRYWLCARMGMSRQQAGIMDDHAAQLNGRVLMISVLFFAALFYVSAQLSLAALVIAPVLHWYNAAYLRCAYHDIFEGGTGVEAKVTQAVNVPAGALAA